MQALFYSAPNWRIPLRIALLAGLAFSALTIPAVAADVGSYSPQFPAAEFNWTGFYFGANVGWIGSLDNNITNTGTDSYIHGLGSALAHGRIPSSVDLSQNGFIGGGQIGYNWQIGSNWVWGIDADFDGVGAKSNATAVWPGGGGAVPFATTYNRQIETLGTIRGRAGFLLSP